MAAIVVVIYGMQAAKVLLVPFLLAVFLAMIAVLPNLITGNIPGLQGNLAYFLGGTSVLIVVGVALQLVESLNAQLVMRKYDGFMKGKSRSGGLGGATAGWAKRR